VGAPIDPELTADAEEGGDVGPLGAGAGTSLCTGKAPRTRQHRAVGRLSAGAPRLHKSCRLRRPQSKGRSCRSGRARRDLRARGGRRHLSERPGWPSGAPISRGSTVSMIAFGGRQGPQSTVVQYTCVHTVRYTGVARYERGGNEGSIESCPLAPQGSGCCRLFPPGPELRFRGGLIGQK
jgi:hypothetical protein